MISIFDARSVLAAGANKVMGKGSESTAFYPEAQIHYMEIGNIHTMRQSIDQLSNLCQSSTEVTWLSELETTGWLGHLRAIISAANVIVKKVNDILFFSFQSCLDLPPFCNCHGSLQ